MARELLRRCLLGIAAVGPAATFADFRAYSLERAAELFGDGSSGATAVAAAWDAVGVYDPNAAPTVYFDPPAGKQGVPAWPALLSFQTPLYPGFVHLGAPTESSWYVEVSPDPQFQTSVQPLWTSTQLAAVGGTISMVAPNLAPSTVYYWRVKAKRGAQLDANWAFTSSFMTSRQQPRGQAPVGQTAVSPWQVRLSWNTVDGATQYEVEVSDGSAFTTLFQSPPPMATTSYSFNGAVHSTYWWRVRAIGPNGVVGDWATLYDAANRTDWNSDDDRERPWAQNASASLWTTDPVPTGLAPQGGTAAPFRVDLSVAGNGAKGYEFATSTTPTYCGLMNRMPVSATPKVTIDVAPSSTIYWCVRAQGYVSDYSGWAGPVQFAVGDGKVTLTGPGATSWPWPATFTWSGGANGQSGYEMELSYDAAFTNPTPHPTGAPMVSFNVIDTVPRIYWRARAYRNINGTELDGAWATSSFVPVSTSPVQIAPQPAAQVTSPVSFSWQAVTGAANYQIWVMQNGQFFTHGSGLTMPSYPNVMLPPGDYCWKVWSYSAENFESPDGQCIPFTVKAVTAAPCDTAVVAGGNEGADYYVNVGATSGLLNMAAELYDVPDQVQVFDDTHKLWDTGCASQKWMSSAVTGPQQFNSPSGRVHVVVTPNCNGTPDTNWQVGVSCAYAAGQTKHDCAFNGSDVYCW
jgi:hypothetical protein